MLMTAIPVTLPIGAQTVLVIVSGAIILSAVLASLSWFGHGPRHRRPRLPPRLGDARAPEEQHLPATFTLDISLGPSGLWHITSNAHRGFQVSVPTQHSSLAEGLATVPEALGEMLRADRKR